MDIKTEKLTRHVNNKGNSKTISHNTVRTVFIDSKQEVWIGTMGGGLNHFDKETQTFDAFKPSATNGISDNYVYSIIEEDSHRLWVGTEGGRVDLFDTKNQTFSSYEFESNYSPSNQIFGKTLFKDSRNMLWIGTNGYELYRYNIIDNTYTHFEQTPNGNGI